jgi:Na+/H+ antiporter
MEHVEIILALLALMLVLIVLANRIRIAYPILLVLGGLGIGLIPGLPKIVLEPNLVFVLFLPPILQLSAYTTSMRDFRSNMRAIGLLAIGLVLTTMCVVALVAHYVIGLPWPSAFVLGAIVAPPDAVAATSIAQRLHLPRRIVTLLEGESMLNDATALVAYRVAVAAVVTGAFSLVEAGWLFIVSALGGIAVGIVIVLLVVPLFRFVRDEAAVYLTLTFLSGYAGYILAEALHVSGVLAVVTIGFLYVQPRFNTMTPELRIQGFVVWDMVVFLLNGLVFILIGLQFPEVMHGLDHASPLMLLGYAALICLTVIVIRFAWVFPGAYVPRLPAKVRAVDPLPAWQHVFVVAWTGMRGVVSLAAALALPITTTGGLAFPGRELIIFLTFCVILGTLVAQGLTLPLLIRWLKVTDDGTVEYEEQIARQKTAQAALDRLQEILERKEVPPKIAAKLRHQYETRIRRFAAHVRGEHDEEVEQDLIAYDRIQRKLIEAELETLIAIRNEQIINDETLRRIQYELDLEWLRLQADEEWHEEH